MALLVYIDDILIIGPSLVEIDHVKGLLHNHFLLKVLGNAKYFLGLELCQSPKVSICLNASIVFKYLKTLDFWLRSLLLTHDS